MASLETVVSVTIDGLISLDVSWFVSSRYYVRAAKDLAEETGKLRTTVEVVLSRAHARVTFSQQPEWQLSDREFSQCSFGSWPAPADRAPRKRTFRWASASGVSDRPMPTHSRSSRLSAIGHPNLLPTLYRPAPGARGGASRSSSWPTGMTPPVQEFVFDQRLSC